MAEARYTCWTKATHREAGPPRRSFNWARSRRAFLRVFDDRIVCGDWEIQAASVRDAVLYEVRQLFIIPVFVLEVSTAEVTYRFGLNPWARIRSHLPFDVRQERLRLGSSPFSQVIRLALLAYLAHLLWRWFNPA